MYKLKIINRDFVVQDKPMKQVTPIIEKAFDKHGKTFLDIGVVRLSKSIHRIIGMIVNFGTTVDPKIGKEIKEK